MTVIFSFNQHPAYLYLLSHIDAEFFIVGEWDTDTRPHPDNIEFVKPADAEEYASKADIWLSHLITPDLVRFLKMGAQSGWPKQIVQVMHGRSDRVGHVESRVRRASHRLAKQTVIPALWLARQRLCVDYVYISDYVTDSWRVEGHTIYPAILPELENTARDSREGHALVVGNELHRGHFAFDLLQEIIKRENIRVCGSNPHLNAKPGRISWRELKEEYRSASCYVNLLRPPENSFNLATLEAIGSGTPIVTLSHPECVFEHGESALVCDSLDEICDAINRIREDDALAEHLQENAYQLAADTFDMQRFRNDWQAVLQP